MSYERKLRERKARRVARVRGRVKRSGKMRVAVFRSLKHIYGQIIDPNGGVTIASSSSLLLDDAERQRLGDKKSIAYHAGKQLAEKAREKGIDSLVFDRGSYLYHGRVRAFAEGMREGGISI